MSIDLWSKAVTEKKMLEPKTNNRRKKMLWLFALVILFVLLGIIWLVHWRAVLLAGHPLVATSGSAQQQIAVQEGPVSNSVKVTPLVSKTVPDKPRVISAAADLSNISANKDNEKARYQFLLNEIEYGLHVGHLQLLATNNIQNAFRILELMKQRLDQFTELDLVPLKQSIALAIEQLKSSPLLDISSLMEKFAALTENVDNLPFLADTYFQSKENRKQLKKLSNGPEYQRMWDQFIQTLRSGIQVRQLDKIDPMLITANQAFFIRENLKLRLLVAKIALMQQYTDTFIESLQDVQHTVKVYFDNQSKMTQTFLDILEKLISLDFSHANPSVFESSLTVIDDLQRKEKQKNATVLAFTSTMKTGEKNSSVLSNKPQLDQPLADKRVNHPDTKQKER